jgi:maleate isomerase
MTQNGPFQSTSVTGSFTPDGGPGKHRIGLVLLSNDYATERDFINMRPSDDVGLFVCRVPNTTDCTLESLPLMAPHITTAAALIVPEGRLDVIAYSCTSGTVVMGYDTICERIHVARPGIPVVTPITASLAALDKFNAKKLAVLTPYVDDVNAAIAAHLEANGREICAFTSFHIEDNELMAALPTEAIYQAALEADRPEAEALFISCTAIRAVDVVDRIESALGKPVVTANQAMVWQALRWSGCNDAVEGYGNLLKLPE